MRELKFRVWCNNGFWFLRSLEDLIRKLGTCGIERVAPPSYDYWTDIEQYTGLKDKKGKEIYEGDIAKMSSGKKLKIVKNKAAFGFYDNKRFNTFSEYVVLPGGVVDYIEVTGNIHENPELLEK